MKNKTVKQHYVPQFYLREFTDKDGFCWVYETKSNKIHKARSEDICFEKNLYETEWTDNHPDGDKFILQNDIENIFAKYEQEFADLISRIKNICRESQRKEALILNSKEKLTLRRFVTNLILRNPTSMETLKMSEVSEEELQSEGAVFFQRFLDILKLGKVESFFEASQKKAMLTEEFGGGMAVDMTKDLMQFDFLFYYAKKGEFITCDMPVCMGYDDKINAEDNRCFFLPITPKVAVLFGNYKKSRLLRNRMCMIEEIHVDEQNMQLIKNNHDKKKIIASSKEVLEKYCKNIKE